MRIAVSSNDNKGMNSTVSEHFGRCPFFTIITAKENVVEKSEVIENPFFQGHQPFEIPNFLKSQNIDVIMTQGMGGRAIGFFKDNDIQPVTGCRGTVKEVLDTYFAGNASDAAPCKDSGEHHHG